MPSESHLSEVEAVLGQISEARERAATAADELDLSDAPAHLVTALRRAEIQLGEDHRRLTQATMFAVALQSDGVPTF